MFKTKIDAPFFTVAKVIGNLFRHVMKVGMNVLDLMGCQKLDYVLHHRHIGNRYEGLGHLTGEGSSLEPTPAAKTIAFKPSKLFILRLRETSRCVLDAAQIV